MSRSSPQRLSDEPIANGTPSLPLGAEERAGERRCLVFEYLVSIGQQTFDFLDWFLCCRHKSAILEQVKEYLSTVNHDFAF